MTSLGIEPDAGLNILSKAALWRSKSHGSMPSCIAKAPIIQLSFFRLYSSFGLWIISNLRVETKSKFSSFAPEGLETTLFQNGCLAFRSPASSSSLIALDITFRHRSHRKHLFQQLFHCYSSIVAVGTCLFAKNLLNNGCCIFAYHMVVAQQRIYMQQYYNI
jgi:hypothetical protein